MPISRRGSLAAGLALIVAGALGAWSGLNADAAVTPAPASAAAGIKAPPPGGAGPSLKAAAADPFYLYGGARQTAAADGAVAALTIGQPKVGAGDHHSLAEIAVQSADTKQIVEIGWQVSPAMYGDDKPHLFVYHWVKGVPGCYNGCGFVVDSAAPVKPGAALPVGTTRNFAIQHTGGAWWVAFNNQWVGYFPDSLWSGAFVRAGLVQWFGEVAAAVAKPCTQMGNGLPATNTGAASFTGMGLVNGPASAISVNAATDVIYSTQRVDATSFRYGGAGAC